jgi:hypothetical protein
MKLRRRVLNLIKKTQSEEDWSSLKEPDRAKVLGTHSSTLLCVTLQVGTLRWLEKNAPFMNSIAITTGVLARKTAMDTISIVFWAALTFTWAPQLVTHSDLSKSGRPLWGAARVSDFDTVFGTIIVTKRRPVTQDDPIMS